MSQIPIERLGAALIRLQATIEARQAADPKSSYTASLLAEGPVKCAKKLGEEAVETAIAAVEGGGKPLAMESADLLYHLMVLWAAAGLSPADVAAELESREGKSGHAEKAGRS